MSLGLIFLGLRRTAIKRNAIASVSKAKPALQSVADAYLRQTMESFLASADAADVNSPAAILTPAFLCVRAADEGGFASLTGNQMFPFLRSSATGAAAGHVVHAKNTLIH